MSEIKLYDAGAKTEFIVQQVDEHTIQVDGVLVSAQILREFCVNPTNRWLRFKRDGDVVTVESYYPDYSGPFNWPSLKDAKDDVHVESVCDCAKCDLKRKGLWK